MSDSLSIALKITGDAKSAVAALEETRRAQLNAFAGGTEAANKAATQWKVAEAEVKRLAQSARESGAGQGELNSKLAEAVAAASKAKSAWADETAALHKRRQALLENKQALEQANAAARAQPPAPSPVDTGRGMLGLVPHEQIRQQIEQVRQAYLGLKASGQLTGAELAQAADRARTRIAALSESMNGARTAGDRMAGAVMLVQKAFIALQAISVGNAVLKTADSMALLQARLKLVEGSTAGANKALDGLNQIAGKASIPVQDAAGAYTKFAQSIYNLGGGQQQALEFTEAIALALRVSGASAQESGSAMLQLGQAMQKGSLNGDGGQRAGACFGASRGDGAGGDIGGGHGGRGTGRQQSRVDPAGVDADLHLCHGLPARWRHARRERGHGQHRGGFRAGQSRRRDVLLAAGQRLGRRVGRRRYADL